LDCGLPIVDRGSVQIFKVQQGAEKGRQTMTVQSKTRNPKSKIQIAPPGEPPFKDMVWIPGGRFLMGSNDHYPEEGPTHYVTVGGFWIDKYTVTNAQFRRFVQATGYVTVAERVPNAEDYPGALPELLVPGSLVFKRPKERVDLRYHYNWWAWVPGASWRHPEGPESNLNGRDRHPVVHVAYEDVEAYAKWIGKELPTEAEWEYAARGKLEDAVYTWGNEFAPRGKMMANSWQGEFPIENLLLDKYERTAPVGSFPPNGYGLFDMAGNVWEWTSDWYGTYGQAGHDDDVSSHQESSCCASVDRGDEARERSFDPQQPDIRIPRKVLKGGSFLCAPNYCLRYRPAARIAQQIDSGTCHQGFRCVVRDALRAAG
jgi:formylglycine-generating enzyme required for sulfatase activity